VSNLHLPFIYGNFNWNNTVYCLGGSNTSTATALQILNIFKVVPMPKYHTVKVQVYGRHGAKDPGILNFGSTWKCQLHTVVLILGRKPVNIHH
jgi:hypothetical protein